MADRIPGPGVYPAMSAQEYHDDPCPEPSLSSSVAKVLLGKSPRHAWETSPRLNPKAERKHKASFDIGTAAHAMLTGVDRGGVVVIDADNYQTKAAKEQRDEAWAAGRTPLLAEQYERTMQMVTAARHQLSAPESEHGNPFELGRCEQAYFAQIDGVWCRCLADAILKPGEAPDTKKGIIYDYKTTATSAHPATIDRVIANLGYDVQAAHYRDTVRAIEGGEWVFRLVMQEKEPPYGLTVVQLSPTWFELGERQIKAARERWGTCLETGVWPFYPAGVIEADPPVYHAGRWYSREEAEEAHRQETGREIHERMIQWQAPTAGAE